MTIRSAVVAVLSLLLASGGLAQSADLVLTKTGSPDPVVAGENLTYTLTVQNAGPTDATAVVLTDEVGPPFGLIRFDSAAQVSGPPATLTHPAAGGQGTFQATMPSLAAGASAIFTLTVRVSAIATFGTTIRNDAAVSASTPDPAPANNSAFADTDVIERNDTLVAKSADGGPHPPGSLLTYTLTIASLGPTIGTNVELVDEIPEHTTFVSAVQTSGQPFSMLAPEPGGTGVFRATSVTQANFFGFFGGTATFELVVQVDEDVPVGTVISNTIRTQFLGTNDPDVTNNTQTVTTVVDAVAPPIPSLSEWMLLLLAAALGLTGVAVIRS